MGTSLSSTTNNDSKQKLPKQSILHERFSQCLVSQQDEQITIRVKVDFSMFQYQYWQKNLLLLKQNPHSDLLFLPKHHQLQKPTITCGTGDNIKMTFDNFPFILEQQIHNRSLNSTPNYLQEEQLWMLLYTLVKSQHAFADLSLKVGDIHPHNIFINTQGQIKLACQFSWPNEKTNFQKMYYDKTLRYLSPQQIKQCQQGQLPDLCYTNTSQAFSIGLTMLSAGILESLDRICDMKTFKFNKKYLQSCINKWMSLKYKHPQTQQITTYSNQLKDIVKNLCNEDIKKRYSVSKIYEILKKYEKEIMSVKKFKIENYFQLIKEQNKQQNKHMKQQQQNGLARYVPKATTNEIYISQHRHNIQQIGSIKQSLPSLNNPYAKMFYKYSTINSDKKITFNLTNKNQDKPLPSNKLSFNDDGRQKQKYGYNALKLNPNIQQLQESILQPKRTLQSMDRFKFASSNYYNESQLPYKIKSYY